MKYRIIIRDSVVYPFLLQRGEVYTEKFLWKVTEHTRWHDISMHNTVKEAQTKMHEDIRACKAFGKDLNPGTVVLEYDEKDLLADKLKGNA